MSGTNVHGKDNEAAVVIEYMDLPTLASRYISWLLQSMILMLFSSRPSLLKGGYNGDAFLSGLLSLYECRYLRVCVQIRFFSLFVPAVRKLVFLLEL